jgi:hypothetical protein
MSAPALGHRPKPNEVWGPHYACTSSLFVFANQNQSPHRVAQEIPAPRFSGSCSVCRTRLSLPQCQLQPQPKRSKPSKVWGFFCMNLTFVRSAAQARLNLFGRQSAPLQHPGSAALPIPAKISDSIALRRSFPELIGSMFAGGRKLRQWRLVKNHFAEGVSVQGPFEPALSHSPYCCVTVACRKSK